MTATPSRFSKNTAAGQLVVKAAEPLAAAAGDFLKNHVGNLVGSTFNAGRDYAYDKLTDQVRAPWDEKKGLEDASYGGLRSPTGEQWSKSDKNQILQRLKSGELGAARNVHPELREDPSGAREFVASFTKQKFPEWAGAAFKNPEIAANIAGVATIAAPVAIAGAGIGMLGSDQRYSDYSVPVSGGGGYNQSVESAAYATMYKQQLEDQKHQHKLELQGIREQSRVPGVQDLSTGGYGGVASGTNVGGMLDRLQSSRPNYF